MSNPKETPVVSSSLATKILGIQSEIGPIIKSVENAYFRSKYADLPTIMEKLQPLLTKYKVVVTHRTSAIKLAAPELECGSIYHVETLAINSENPDDILTVSIPLYITKDKTPQVIGAAITYYRRYGIGMIFGIVTDEDDDGNLASNKVPGPPQFQKAPSSPSTPTVAKAATPPKSVPESKPESTTKAVPTMAQILKVAQSKGGTMENIMELLKAQGITTKEQFTPEIAVKLSQVVNETTHFNQ